MNLLEKTDLKSRLRLKSQCACGKNHEIVTETIIIGKNLTERLYAFTKSKFGNDAKDCVICDNNTARIARDNMRRRGESVTLDIRSHHAGEFMVEACDDILKNKNCDYFIACGSGTIHDITRIIAHKYGKPFISYPTAPSVDGFVSVIAPITTKDGMKISYPAVAPIALFGDIDVISAAPKRLAASGTGDILGKYIALADWRISNLLTGEYICNPTVDFEYSAIKKVRDSIVKFSKNKNGESYGKFCEDLLEALVISGLCMQYTGNSRPASGAEHHIAHFFEMETILPNDFLHGENVGIGTVLCADLYHEFADADNIKFVENYSMDKDLIKKYYSNIYDEIIKENKPNSLKKVTPEIFYDNLEQIRNIISEIPTADEFTGLFDILGGAKELNGISSLALKLAPYIRDRLTLLKLMKCIEFTTVQGKDCGSDYI